MHVARGGPYALGTVLLFGRKLGAAWAQAGRLDEARFLLEELMELAGPDDLDRALLLEEQARVATLRDRPVEAERYLQGALAIAGRGGDLTLIGRLADRLGIGPACGDGTDQMSGERPIDPATGATLVRIPRVG